MRPSDQGGGAVRGWIRACRQPARTTRLALALWGIWALVVWNVVFDRVLVLAGRRFVYEAAMAAAAGRPYLSAADWMRDAAQRGFWLATAAAVGLGSVGVLLIRLARRTGGAA